jgi:hypothetical protein
MARTTIVKLLDDLDGSEAAETVQFAVEGVAYEIDLSEGNAKELRAAVAPYVEAGRKQTGEVRRPVSTRATDRVENWKIRTWARNNGHEVAERGRIPQDIIDEYRKAV